jgi:hypothetical protein
MHMVDALLSPSVEPAFKYLVQISNNHLKREDHNAHS